MQQLTLACSHNPCTIALIGAKERTSFQAPPDLQALVRLSTTRWKCVSVGPRGN